MVDTAVRNEEGHEWLKRSCVDVVYTAAQVLRLLTMKLVPSMPPPLYWNGDEKYALKRFADNVRVLLGTAWFDPRYSSKDKGDVAGDVDEWLELVYDDERKTSPRLEKYLNSALRSNEEEEEDVEDKSFGRIVKEVLSNLWEEPPNSK